MTIVFNSFQARALEQLFADLEVKQLTLYEVLLEGFQAVVFSANTNVHNYNIYENGLVTDMDGELVFTVNRVGIKYVVTKPGEALVSPDPPEDPPEEDPPEDKKKSLLGNLKEKLTGTDDPSADDPPVEPVTDPDVTAPSSTETTTPADSTTSTDDNTNTAPPTENPRA